MSQEQPTYHPPKWANRFLCWFCDSALVEDVEGDLAELFAYRAERDVKKAKRQYWLDVVKLFRPGIIKKLSIFNGQNQISMFNNYLKIAVRNALRYKGYSALNIFGLVVGIATSILILLWINDEEGVNAFHENGDQIYQVFRNMRQSNGQVSTSTSIPKPLGDLALETYPEVEDMAWLSWEMDARFQYEDQNITRTGRLANPSFLKMFSFAFLIGDKNTALDDWQSAIISKDMAYQLHGEQWLEKSIGTTLKFTDRPDAIVTGVFENTGDNSSLKFDWLAPTSGFISQNDWVEDWGNGAFGTFLLVNDKEKAQAVSDKILMEIKDHTKGNPRAGDEELIIQKFSDTYLYSNFNNGVIDGGRIDYVRIMKVVALFILLVACINFMNLTTARASRRSKEIGVRKVLGAERKAIRTQFYTEAYLFALIATILSLVLVFSVLPAFNLLVQKNLSLDFASPTTWYLLSALVLIVGFLSGSYPAILLPKLSINDSMKGISKQSAVAVFFRKGLVVFQFAISTLLIIGTAVVYKQMGYVLNKDLGIEYHDLVSIRLEESMIPKLETYKNELLRIPEVSSVTASSGNPMNYGRSTSSADWDGRNPEEGYEVNVILTDRDFVTTTGVEVKTGRAFSKELADSTGFIINEVMAEMIGYDDPVDQRLSFWGIDGKIIGVVKDFHMQNLHQPIAPLIITCITDEMSSEIIIKIDRDAGAVLPQIEKVSKDINAGMDFEYEFLETSYAEQYKSETTLSTLANIFAFISIVISGLGLLGLASYSAEQRSKEIGVRKVHGASIAQILMLLSKDYTKLILLGFLIAAPAGWYLTKGWLEGFEFRTNLDIGLFFVAGSITFLIGIITVAGKSYHAASMNPVKSLKEE